MLATTLSGILEEGGREYREDRKPSKTGGPYRFLLRAKQTSDSLNLAAAEAVGR
jgi:hypothetical protein